MSQRQRRGCDGKIRHPTQQEALDALYSLARNRGAQASQMRAYKCPACGTWHVGHKIGLGRRRK